jgi:glutathione S-transferase
MYTLYYSPGACSMAIHVVLNELGVPFKLENASISDGKNRTEEFLRLNPRGAVPVLVEEGKPLTEGAAILLHLVEKHGSGLMPKSGWERAKAMEALMFCNATLHPAYGRAFFVKKSTQDEAAKKQLNTVTGQAIQKIWEEVEVKLASQPYLCGKECTVADILLTVIANWSNMLPVPITFGPKTKQLFRSVIARPAYKKALEAEQVEYKVAA